MSSGKGRMIVLFNSTMLQGDCSFVKEFFHFEKRITNNPSQNSHSGAEKQRFQRLSTTNQRNPTKKLDSCNLQQVIYNIVASHPSIHQASFFLCLTCMFHLEFGTPNSFSLLFFNNRKNTIVHPPEKNMSSFLDLFENKINR